MFRLHERTIRLLCRLGFVALCLAPTAAVGLAIGWTRSGAFVRQEERSLEAALGLEASIARASLPRPGITRLEEVVLRDRDQHRELARIDWLEIASGGPATRAAAGRVELDGSRLHIVRECIERQLAAGDAAPVRWSVGQIVVATDSGSISLFDAAGRRERSAGGPIATASFRLVDREDSPAVGIRAWRDLQTEPPVIGWELRTPETDVPCGLLSLAVPAVARFGPEATFRGGLWLAQTGSGWHGATTATTAPCRLRHVELAALVGEQFPHAISGQATIEIGTADVADGRIVQMEGSLLAAGGTMGTSLLAAASEQLDCRQADDLAARVERVGFEQMAWAFRLDRRGLTLSGRCDIAPAALVVDKFGPLLVREDDAPVPIANLVRLLAPAATADVPANACAASLLGVLPVEERLEVGGRK